MWTDRSGPGEGGGAWPAEAVSLPHPWPASVAEALAVQAGLRRQVILEDDWEAIHTVAGVDVSYDRDGKTCRAAVVVLRLPELTLLESAVASQSVSFPYVPGLLAFRELPAALAALKRLATAPDLLLCDGHGYAHPRRFGLACHLGLVSNLPAIGVAKNRLVGQHAAVAPERGAWQPLLDEGEIIGAVLRTRSGIRPVYVSVGYRVSLPTAIQTVLRCTAQYRLPEPIRRAHRLAARPQAHSSLPAHP